MNPNNLETPFPSDYGAFGLGKVRRHSVMSEIQARIEKALERVRPLLAMHRGGVDFVSYNEETKVLKVRLNGTCRGCPLAGLTMKAGIEDMVKSEAPEVASVEAVE